MCDHRNMPEAVSWIKATLPILKDGGFSVTSDHTCTYNCIAWAAGDTEKWWWPSPDYYWPNGAPLEETIDAFILAFQTQGYQPCDDSSSETGYEKVAIYAIAGRPKHMARQLISGAWSSKLGRAWDIEHFRMDAVECNEYGRGVKFLRRPLK